MNNATISALIANHEAIEDESARLLDNPPFIEIPLTCKACNSSGNLLAGWAEIKHYADKGEDMPTRLYRDACEMCPADDAEGGEA